MKKLKKITLDLKNDDEQFGEETLNELYRSLTQCTILEKIDVKCNLPFDCESDAYQRIKQLNGQREKLFTSKCNTITKYLQYN